MKEKTIVTWPLPESQMAKFVNDLMSYYWETAFCDKTVNHSFLHSSLDKYFPEKTTKMSRIVHLLDVFGNSLNQLREILFLETGRK